MLWLVLTDGAATKEEELDNRGAYTAGTRGFPPSRFTPRGNISHILFNCKNKSNLMNFPLTFVDQIDALDYLSLVLYFYRSRFWQQLSLRGQPVCGQVSKHGQELDGRGPFWRGWLPLARTDSKQTGGRSRHSSR